MKRLRPFKTSGKTMIITSIFYLILSVCAIFLIQQHLLQLDTNRALNRVQSVESNMKTQVPISLDNSIRQLPRNTHNVATRTINEGANYAREIQGDKITVTIPVNQGGQRVSYLAVTDQLTSTTYPTFLIIGLSAIFWLISIIGSIRRSVNLINYTENMVAKIKNIERSPLTQSYLITTEEDPITTALNHLGEKIQQRILSGQETKKSLYEFIEFFQFPIFIYDGKGFIHRSNAAFQNEFSDTLSIDSFSQYTTFLNFLVDKIVHPDIQEKTFYFEKINSYYQVYFNPLEMVEGRYLVMMNDVSQYHQIIQSHTDFIENVSKAFEEPLYRIETNLEKTIPENRPEKQKIKKDLSWLKSLVTDTLLLSRPPIRTKKTKIQLSRLFDEVIQTFEPQIRQKSLKILIDISNGNSPDISLHIEAEKLKLILTKLLENSIYYTSNQGEISLIASQVASKTNISVSDTGTGLTAIQRSRIFERFYRTSQGKASNNGTGLGLAIVKKNVEELGGHIHVESQIGRGTTFTIRLKN